MSTGIAPRQTYELAPPEVLGGGVLSVARVIDTSGHDLLGIEATTDACATAEEWAEWCTVSGTKKLFDDVPQWVVGDPLAIYTGVECDMQRMDDALARVRQRFDYAEGRALDYAIGARLAADPDTVDLGGPIPVGSGLGAAEAFAATVYGGVPTLLIPRIVLGCVCGPGMFSRQTDGSLTTCTGAMVAPLTTPVLLPYDQASEATLYVTGQITLLRGPVQTYSVPSMVESDGTLHPPRALAERIYVPVFECLVGKLEVTCG